MLIVSQKHGGTKIKKDTWVLSRSTTEQEETRGAVGKEKETRRAHPKQADEVGEALEQLLPTVSLADHVGLLPIIQSIS